MIKNQKKIGLIYGVVLFLCLMPFVSPAISLGIGLVFSFLGLRQVNISKYSSFALQSSIVLMGFGMNLTQVISTSKTGFVDTAISVVFVMGVGLLIGKFLKVDSKIAMLVSSGTAICGGSAIAAVGSYY